MDMDFERLFWRIARSYTLGEYYPYMDELKKYNQGAYDSLLRTSPPTWSRAFWTFCNDILNNLCESFNRTIANARRKPLLDMLEEIRRQCMQRNAKRSIIANRRMHMYTPRAHAELELVREKAKECVRYRSTGGRHEIELHGVACTVDMLERTCGCVRWQLNGLPCIHVMCVITSLRLRAEDYTSDHYSTQMWRQVYNSGIQPVQGMTYWPRMHRLPVLPPPSRLQNRGRESNHARRKGPHETTTHKGRMTRDGRIPTCSLCKQEGHNKRRCSNPILLTDKRPRGRPKKNQGGESSQRASQTASHGASEAASQGASQGRS